MRLTQGYNEYVAFLEEDHYLSPDFLHMANILADQKPGYSHLWQNLTYKWLTIVLYSMCPHCDFMGLGVYDKRSNYGSIANTV